jgi:3-hydroxyisobutyrate dehydrogenase
MNITIIGLGEVGRAYAKALHAAGHTLQLCNARAGVAAQACADALGLPLHLVPGEWLRTSDAVLLCVTGSAAPQVVAHCTPWMAPGATLCDMTTASPDAKRSAAAVLRQQGLQYLDVAIMGAVAMGGHTTPLLVAGDDAGAFKHWMEAAGGRVSALPAGTAGDAMALKLLRSTFTKGLEALSVELLMAAERQGLREALYTQLQDIDDTPLRTFLDMLVRTHVLHAKRRSTEVQEATTELARQGLESVVLPGVAQRFAKTVAALDAHPLDPAGITTEQALQWLLQQEG